MRLILTIFSFLISFNAFSADCSKLRDDLLSVENALQNSCIKQSSDGSCCPVCVGNDCDNESYSLECVSRRDLNALYNEKMAELIIQEGIASIMLSIAGNYNSLNDLTKEKLSRAKSYIGDVNRNLTSADLLYHALSTNEDGNNTGDVSTFFNNFDYKSSNTQLGSFISKNCKSNQFKNMTFCKKVEIYKKSSPEFFTSFLETLNGFLKTDKRVSDFDDARKTRYTTYQNKLRIKKGERLLTPEQFKNDNDFKKMRKVSSYLDNLPTLSNDEKEKFLKELNGLNKIDVSFNNVETDNLRTTNYLKTNFDLPFAQLDLPSLIANGEFEDHFTNAIKKVDQDFNNSERAFEQKIKNQDQGSISSLRSKCKSSSQDNIMWLCNELKIFDKNQKSISMLGKAKKCLLTKDFNAKKKCLIDAQDANAYNKSLKKLKQELKDIESALSAQDDTPSFKNLNLHKAMGIHAIEKNYCLLEGRKKLHGIHNTNCSPQETLIADTEVYNLAQSGSKFSVEFNNQLIKNTLSSLNQSDSQALKSQFINECNKGVFKKDSLCQYYIDQENWQARLEDELERRKNVKKVVLPSEPETDYSDIAIDQLTRSTVAYSGPIINSFAQTWIMRSNAKSAKNSIKAYDDYYMAYYRSYLNSQNNQPATDYGQGQFGYNFSSYSNFQAQNQSTIFRNNTNPFQYRMSAPNPVNISTLIQSN